MRTYLSLLLVFIGLCTTANAEANYPFSAGLYLSAKTGYNMSYSPVDRKNIFIFNGMPDFGLSFYFPSSLNNNIGITTDLGLTTYAYKVKGLGNDISFNLKYSYITFSPAYYFRGLMAGFNFGLPVSADYGAKIETNKLNILAEVKAGAIIPLISDESGRVNVIISVG